MKINLKLFAFSLVLSASLLMVACQNSSDAETAEAKTEETKQETMANNQQKADQLSMNNANKQNKPKVDPNQPTTSISFEQPVYDFGTVEKGGKVEHTYTFTNTGSEPLIIVDAKASCGCTVPKKPTEPIMPGETGEIPVIFTGKGAGKATKTITVTANTNPPQTRLTITGQVTKPEGEEKES